jgi:hypothetical protein
MASTGRVRQQDPADHPHLRAWDRPSADIVTVVVQLVLDAPVVAVQGQQLGKAWGTRPFLRCQDKSLLSMAIPQRISNLPSAVLPRDCSMIVSRAPSWWCHPVVSLPETCPWRAGQAGTHPAARLSLRPELRPRGSRRSLVRADESGSGAPLSRPKSPSGASTLFAPATCPRGRDWWPQATGSKRKNSPKSRPPKRRTAGGEQPAAGQTPEETGSRHP